MFYYVEISGTKCVLSNKDFRKLDRGRVIEYGSLAEIVKLITKLVHEADGRIDLVIDQSASNANFNTAFDKNLI